MSVINEVNYNINGINRENVSTPAEKNDNVELLSLNAGQTLTGKVIAAKGDEATINIGGNIINAKIDNGMSLKPGQSVTFSLKSISNDSVTLSPLYTNMNSQEVAARALNNASLPISEKNLEITGNLIEKGFGIDKESLSNLVHLSNTYPDEDISNLARMQKFGLDVNPDNIDKFKAFMNYENKISDGLNSITQSIGNAVDNLISAGKDDEAAKLLAGVIKTFSGADADGTSSVNINPNQANAETINVGNPVKVMQNEDVQGIGNNGESITREKMVITEDILVLKPEDPSKTVDEYQIDAKINSENSASLFENNVHQPAIENEKSNIALNTKIADAWQSISGSDKSQMVDVLRQSGLGEDEFKFLNSDKATQNDFLEATGNILAKGNISDSLKDLIQSDNFSDILKSQMQAQMFLAPIDTENKKTVESLYGRLNNQIKQITQAVEGLNINDNNLSSSLSDMNDNLDFMQQMNQMAQYIQLPLKMNGSEATGDLYVYTDKKSLAEKKGAVSALLHLDMKNLGPLDVYASISTGNKVYTKFYLSDDSMIDFIGANIHILNERLEKRGYNMKSEVVMMNKDNNERPIEPPIIDEGKNNEGKKLIAKYGFDCFA